MNKQINVEKEEQTPLLCRAENIFYSYGNHPVLFDVSLRIAKGECVTIFGPNGSGKTTLLQILAGVKKPSTGKIYINGHNIQSLPPKKRGQLVGYTAQLDEEVPPFTLVQNTLFGRYPWQNMFGFTTQEDAYHAEQAMQLTETKALQHKMLQTLSGGERQRASLARTLCQNPQLFVLDEPTSALDYKHQLLLMQVFKNICRTQNKGVVFVSHDINLAAMYADTFILLHNGRIKAYGTAQEVLTEKLCSLAFGCKIVVDTHPITNTPRISLVP